MIAPLRWTTIINGRCQRAIGSRPGWFYEITKDGNHNWSAWFLDETGKRTELAGGLNYARAKGAANAHHRNPGSF